MKYHVNLVYTTTACVDVEANSLEEAEELAIEQQDILDTYSDWFVDRIVSEHGEDFLIRSSSDLSINLSQITPENLHSEASPQYDTEKLKLGYEFLWRIKIPFGDEQMTESAESVRYLKQVISDLIGEPLD